MLLLVDAGNTRVKWAIAESDAAAGNWLSSGSADSKAVTCLGEAWHGLKINRVLLSNVAGPAVADTLQQALSLAFGLTPVPVEWFRSVPQLAGVRNSYRDPGQLGCDRFAAAIGARALFPGQTLLIATCGTATTIDVVTADGVFIGGMILPGLRMMTQALTANTAQLPQVTQQMAPAQVFADNTADAIASGCIAAQAGAIGYAASACALQYGEARCLLSGGAAPALAPHLGIPYDKVDNLVLTGLHVAASTH